MGGPGSSPEIPGTDGLHLESGRHNTCMVSVFEIVLLIEAKETPGQIFIVAIDVGWPG